MKYFHSPFILLLLLLFLFRSCDDATVHQLDEIAKTITPERLMTHIEKLASDEMQGRLPGTEGEEKAVSYIISMFEEAGLEPGMPDGSFRQPVPLLGQTTDRNTANLAISKNGNEILNFQYGAEFMAWPADQQEEIRIENAELVYVGYGIQAPEENWDDFKDVDVAGKILVVKNFNPVTHSEKFGGGIRLYYGRWGYKFEKARELGALGALIIFTDETAGYPWSVVENSWGRERFNLMVTPEYPMELEGWLNRNQSEALFQAAGLSLDDMLKKAENQDFSPVVLPNLRLSASLNASYRSINGTNVVGKITGSDPKLRDQAIVFSAHHDHLGANEQGIFNGAWDNASGTAQVIELARTLQKISGELKRSVYFVTVTAEEAGLLGSRYFAQNPPIHPGNMAANINLDSANIFGRTRDIVAIGYGRSTLDAVLRKEAERVGRIVKPDQNPEQGFYYRSDHFSFAHIGVPALYPNRGNEFLDYPENYLQQVLEKTSRIYHTIYDEVQDWWDLRGAAEDTQLIFHVTHRIANMEARPAWTPGDEFEAARLRALKDLGVN